MKFLVICDGYKPETEALADEILRWCGERGAEARVQPLDISVREESAQTVALVLGGDGFIMRQAKRLQKAKIPLLGINFGRKGVLARAEQNDWQERLSQILSGDYEVEKRIMLHAEHLASSGEVMHSFEVVNDVYVRHPKRMIVMELSVNGELAHTEVHADGVVICSATGSTAYFRTSGGHPFPAGIGVNFICPMDMNLAPLVQAEDDTVEVVLKDIGYFKKEPAFLIADGEDVEMRAGERLLVKKSRKKVYFVSPKGFSWFHVAQRKLGLSR